MAKKIFVLFFCFFFLKAACQKVPSAAIVPASEPSHLRVSLILAGPGEENWSAFGHICIRIIDSSRNDAERDKVYHFGMMDDYSESIMHQFLTKRVKAALDTVSFFRLLEEHVETGRWLTEYLLLLNDEQKKAILAYLKSRIDYKNRFYEYDTFFDNCATRIRDLFEEILGGRLQLGNVASPNSGMTFRNVSFNRYCPPQSKFWFGLGINIVYAGRIDNVMNNREAMFVPVYLAEGISNGTIDGEKIYGGKQVILEEKIEWKDTVNAPFITSLIIALLTMASLLYAKSRIPVKIMCTVILYTTSAIGCFILYTMWLDGEPSWTRNLNLLWALPCNFLLPLLGKKAKRWYTAVAMSLIGLAILVYILKIQFIPLFEIGLLLLAALWVYGFIYRRNMR